MAATTKLIQLRPMYRPGSTTGPTSIWFSSFSNTPDHENSPQTNPTSPPPASPQSSSSFSSYLSDVKATLKQHQGNPQSQSTSSPFSFSFSSPTSNAPHASRSPSRLHYEEIRKNLSEFRRHSNVPPPSPTSSPPQSPKPLSFQELFRQNATSRGEESSSPGSKSVGRLSFNAIKEKLGQVGTTTTKNQNEKVGQTKDAISLSKYKESLKLQPGDRSEPDSSRLIGGGDSITLSIFQKEIREKVSGSANPALRTKFLISYDTKELGEKLRVLRPEKKGNWFSLQELNERLKKLRGIEEREIEEKKKQSNEWYVGLMESLVALKNSENEKPKSTSEFDKIFRNDLLSFLCSGRLFVFALVTVIMRWCYHLLRLEAINKNNNEGFSK